ncbi:MAG: phosphonate metabolism protein/1,5-bisphosphokinase (PRPP-forming) PhnN [Reyranella sp.]
MSDADARYAIYYVPPPASPLARFGAQLLGRDVETGAEVPFLPLDGVSPEEQRERTKSARHYGFHATLKPPFRLDEGVTASQLEAALCTFAAATPPVILPELALQPIGGFLALQPSARSSALEALAADCVVAFDRFRAPAPESELAERRAAGLTPAQDALLRRWGYPYVLREFRFHMTLTDSLAAADRARWCQALADHVDRLSAGPVRIGLALVRQSDRARPFRVVRHVALTGTSRRRQGHLFLVVGPSGAGKDSLIGAAREALPADAFHFPTRVITRDGDAGGEMHRAVSPDDFAALRAAGRFCLSWNAHGLSYGVPAEEVLPMLAAGRHVVVNVSRSVIGAARRHFAPALSVLNVTAPSAVLAQRIAARGRESSAEIAARVARPVDPPHGRDVIEFVNDAPFAAARAYFVALLQAWSP